MTRSDVADASSPPTVNAAVVGAASMVGPVGDRARSAWTKYAATIAVVAGVTWWSTSDPYWLNLITGGLLFAGLASAWNIIGGFGGQFSFGHGVFFGVGAYSVALLAAQHGWSPWAALIVSVALASLVGAVLAYPLFRLRGPFFAIGTLALNEVAFSLTNYFGFTGGPRGVLIPFTATPFHDRRTWAWVMLGYVAFVAAISQLIVRNRLGFWLLAVRDDEDAAEAAGANVVLVKSVGLVISAGLTGLGGGLFAMFVSFIDPPSVYDLGSVGARMPLLVLIGGIGTIIGPIVGALVLQPGEAYLRGHFAGLPPGGSLIVVSTILILAALFFKQGIWGSIRLVWRRIRVRR